MNYINLLVALLISAFFTVVSGNMAPTLVPGPVGHLAVFAVSFIILLFVIRGRRGAVQRPTVVVQPAPHAQVSSRTTSTASPAAPAESEPADPNRKIDVKAELQPDSSVIVVVTVSGFTGAEFKKRIRPRLQQVSGIKWKHPTNIGDGARRMEGTVKAGTRADLAVAAVKAVH